MTSIMNKYESRFTSPEYISWRLTSGPCDSKYGIPFCNRFNPRISVHVFRNADGSFSFGFKKILSASTTICCDCSEKVVSLKDMIAIVRDFILIKKEDADKGADSFNRLNFDAYIVGDENEVVFKKAVDVMCSYTA